MMSERHPPESDNPVLVETRFTDRWPETWSRPAPALTGHHARSAFDYVNQLAARALRVPLSLSSVMDRSRQIVLGAYGLPQAVQELPVGSSFCGLVLARGTPVVIRDARKISELADISAVREGWIAYLGVPVRDGLGEVVASLYVIDRQPRLWRVSDLDLLQSIAGVLEHEFGERAAEQRLHKSEARLHQILDASGAGTWAWDAVANTETWDATFRRQFGFSEDEPATFDGWLARVHPEDRPGLEARLQEILVSPGGDRWDREFRLLLPSGEVRWMRGFGQAAHDGAGQVTGVSGVNFM